MIDELEQYQDYLNSDFEEELPLVVERSRKLQEIISRSGKMFADAKRALNEKKLSEIMSQLHEIAKRTPHATPKAVNAMIDTLCRDEQYLVDWAEQVNKTAKYQFEECRSLMSLAKAEMNYDVFIKKGQ